MTVLGWTKDVDDAPCGVDLHRSGSLSVLVSRAALSGARARLALQMQMALHLEAFLPISPVCPRALPEILNWTVRHKSQIQAQIAAVQGCLQVTLQVPHCARRHDQHTSGAAFLRAQASQNKQLRIWKQKLTHHVTRISSVAPVFRQHSSTVSADILVAAGQINVARQSLHDFAAAHTDCTIVAPLPVFGFALAQAA